MEVKFRVISQGLYFKSVICSKTIYMSDLYDAQFGVGGATPHVDGYAHSNTGWLQDYDIVIPIKQPKPRKPWRSWIPFSTPLSSQPPPSHPPIAVGWFPTTLFGEKSMAAYNTTTKSEPLLEKQSTSNATTAAVEEKKVVKITVSFRIIHSAKLLQLAASTITSANNITGTSLLQPPSSLLCHGSTAGAPPPIQPFIFASSNTCMSEFHFLCSCAPAAVVLEVATL